VRLTYSEAAAHIGVKLGTLRAMVCQKKVPHIRLGGRLVVFDRDALDEWLAERAVSSRRSA
jgi:excisionase family DNA binding protein